MSVDSDTLVDGDGAVDAADDDLADLKAAMDARFGVHRDRIEALEEDLQTLRDDARADRAELRATVEDLQHDVAKLRYAVEQLKGLGEQESTTPAARVRDLRATMINRAESLTDRAGVKLWWEEVQDLLADHGHGEVKAPECYAAMETAAEADGFELTTKTNANGNDVKAIRLQTAALPTRAGVSDSKNSEGVAPAANGGDLSTDGK